MGDRGWSTLKHTVVSPHERFRNFGTLAKINPTDSGTTERGNCAFYNTVGELVAARRSSVRWATNIIDIQRMFMESGDGFFD